MRWVIATREERRQVILDSARHLLREHGWHAVALAALEVTP